MFGVDGSCRGSGNLVVGCSGSFIMLYVLFLGCLLVCLMCFFSRWAGGVGPSFLGVCVCVLGFGFLFWTQDHPDPGYIRDSGLPGHRVHRTRKLEGASRKDMAHESISRALQAHRRQAKSVELAMEKTEGVLVTDGSQHTTVANVHTIRTHEGIRHSAKHDTFL